MTTVNAPQVWAIYAVKHVSPNDVYTVAKQLKTKLMTYHRFCDLMDLIIMAIVLEAAGRVSASERANWRVMGL